MATFYETIISCPIRKLGFEENKSIQDHQIQ
jgi:hypothetical protein